MSPQTPPLLGDRARLVATLTPVVATTLGVSPEVARAGLEAEVAAWDVDALAALTRELPDDWMTRTRAPRTVLVIAARTLPASLLRQCLLARSLGARVHLKCAAGQEAIADTLAALDPGGIVATPFASDDAAAVARAVEGADTVVVLGGDDTVAAVRARVPADRGFAPYGNKVSAAWIGPGATRDEVAGLPGDLAGDLADDLLAWDLAGCMAPQVVWVEGGLAAAVALARDVVAAIAEREPRLPLADVSAHRLARQRVVPLAAMLGGQSIGTATTLLASLPDPTFRPSPGPRIAWFLPADHAALAAIAPSLSRLGVAGAAAQRSFEHSAPRCRVGEMQRPPLAWRQDGLHPLGALLLPLPDSGRSSDMTPPTHK